MQSRYSLSSATQFEQIDRVRCGIRCLLGHDESATAACFNPQLLHELRSYRRHINSQATVSRMAMHIRSTTQYLRRRHRGLPIRRDLALFRSAIVHRDRDQLETLAKTLCRRSLPWHRNFDLPVTTTRLCKVVRSEGASRPHLASSVSDRLKNLSRMGFPECCQSLPGMGDIASFSARSVAGPLKN